MSPSAPAGGGLVTALRVVVALVGLLVPLHLPFMLPEPGAEKTLGWWSRSRADGRFVVTQTTWAARESGLALGDVVVRVQGRPASGDVVRSLLAEARVGDVMTLDVSRQGRPLRVTVPVERSSGGTVLYWWLRVLLVLASWTAGMALVVWQGRAPAALVLGTALLLASPVVATVSVPVHYTGLRTATAFWQFESVAFRFFFPALLAHFLWLQPRHGGRPGTSRLRWVLVYGAAVAAVAITTDAFTNPVAWARPGPERIVRAFVGMAFESAALVVAVRVLRRRIPSALRWVSQSAVLYLLLGIAVSVMMLLGPTLPSLVESIRQMKSLALVLLVITSLVYALTLAEGRRDWELRRRMGTVASTLLTVLFGFAVAGAAAVVHAREAAPGQMDMLLFGAIFLAAIGFSPVLSWAREMVDGPLTARLAALEGRIHAFTDRLAAELEPARIAERVAAEVPPLLGVARAELVLSRETVEAWRLDGDAAELRVAPAADLAAETEGAGWTAVAVHRVDGEPLGLLRVWFAPGAVDLEPAERAALATLAGGVASALRIAEAYLRLSHARRELADGERLASLGALAGGLAHEIKNPLAGLKLGLHLLAREGAPPARLDRLSADVRRIDDLVTGLLAFGPHARAGKAEPVDACSVVAGCVDELAPLAEDRCARLGVDLPGEAARVQANPTVLRLVVATLVKNALDAVGEGGAVDVAVSASAAWVEVVVADDGPGIPPPLRERVFELAFSTKPGGSGIGLALARRQTERLGGSIAVEPGGGEGTRIRVRLPRAHA